MFSLFHLVEILIKEEGKFLDLTGVPDLLKLRSGLRKYLYIRDCYEDFVDDIVASLPLKARTTIAILGTAGIGLAGSTENAGNGHQLAMGGG